MPRKHSKFKIPLTKNPRQRVGVILTISGALLSFNLVVASESKAHTRPAEGFQCRAFASDVRSRAGNSQIIEPIRASNNCLGDIAKQSLTVTLQHWNNRQWPLRDRWETVSSRKTSKKGPGRLQVSTRWNCGDPHRNNAGRVRLRVVATGEVLDWNGDYFGASTRSRNEITRDCAV